jgi:hypothetical protein
VPRAPSQATSFPRKRESTSRPDVDPRFRGGDADPFWFAWTEWSMSARSKARANRAKSGWVNFSRRLSSRTAIKKPERRGRRSPVPDDTGRSFDAPVEYSTVAMTATEKTRVPQCGMVRACIYLLPVFNCKFVLYLRVGMTRQVGR